MSDDVIEQAAEVLYRADPFTTGSAAIARRHATREWRGVVAQAEALADAGLLPTEVEWGRRRKGHGYINGPLDEDVARKAFGDDLWTLVSRRTAPWKDAP